MLDDRICSLTCVIYITQSCDNWRMTSRSMLTVPSLFNFIPYGRITNKPHVSLIIWGSTGSPAYAASLKWIQAGVSAKPLINRSAYMNVHSCKFSPPVLLSSCFLLRKVCRFVGYKHVLLPLAPYYSRLVEHYTTVALFLSWSGTGFSALRKSGDLLWE